MKIGILGAGGIGGNLGRLWAKAGHEVHFASRHPERLADLATQAGRGATAGTVAQAVDGADVVLDALPYAAALDIDPASVAGKVLISASNYYRDRDGALDLRGLSQTEAVAARLPGVRVVKAFNMMRADEFAARAEGASRPPLAIYVAGDDTAARSVTEDLVRDARFAPVEVGSLANGALFEVGAPLYDMRVSEADARVLLAEYKP
ncbi:NADPH-dependent F420 reductase [Aestuariibius insulae]|uniref:NADPH-dependent F420 reductase n=1 Tax=Aestuariibius insulae TaxID=2058287 RepID=UPI00345E86CE